VKALFARFQASRAWLAWQRYSDARGNILAAGMTYFAFFSIFPAVVLAFTVFGFVLRGNPDLLQVIADQLNANLPGFVKDERNPNGLIPIQAPQAATLTITGVIGFVTLLLAGMGWLGAVREGIRAVFGVQGQVGNVVTTKLRDLGVLVTLGLGIAVTAVLTSGVAAAADWIAGLIGLSGQGWIVELAGLTVSVLADTALMILLLRVLSGVSAPWRDLFQGALVGGVGFSLLKLFAGTLLPLLTDNPLFASIAIVVGLLIWLNLIARLTLVAAAWAANDIDRRRQETRSHELGPPSQGSEPVATPESAMATPAPSAARGRSFGSPSGDRVSLAAGAVLGATAMVAAGAVAYVIRSGLRSVAGPARR
jgi:membrane protein